MLVGHYGHAVSFQPFEKRLVINAPKRRVSFCGRMKVRIDAEMHDDAAATKPDATTLREV